MAGLPALQDGELGQVRKEAATAAYCKCRGSGSPPPLSLLVAFTHFYLDRNTLFFCVLRIKLSKVIRAWLESTNQSSIVNFYSELKSIKYLGIFIILTYNPT